MQTSCSLDKNFIQTDFYIQLHSPCMMVASKQ